MGKRSIERGPVAQRVAENIRDLRRSRDMTLQELSDRLAEVGRPVVVSGVGKMEQTKAEGARRVDVDDLVALALALDVSPLRLLLTATAAPDELTELSQDVRVSERVAWLWGRGEASLWLVAPKPDPTVATGAEWYRRDKEFPKVNRPDVQKPDPRKLIAHGGELQALWRSVRKLADEMDCSWREVLEVLPDAGDMTLEGDDGER
ncbi:helix-turn-helix domain-containing protein [Lentzea nigeriaca]|uniref:helix-turn-helix domain-containing protein n=1 Tax=Lentzea nigeriaca TaxID=1128665 RepID=UPI00195A753F|nr:helix-turn-helix transcriptional regulator [Lentzea nigeriaca]MBM7860426.1 transcriptional regulator with XRE-family HTH domain [Lentzea nigeriaca]